MLFVLELEEEKQNLIYFDVSLILPDSNSIGAITITIKPWFKE